MDFVRPRCACCHRAKTKVGFNFQLNVRSHSRFENQARGAVPFHMPTGLADGLRVESLSRPKRPIRPCRLQRFAADVVRHKPHVGFPVLPRGPESFGGSISRGILESRPTMSIPPSPSCFMHKTITKPDIYPLYASINDQFLGSTEANMRKMWVFSEITDPETAHDSHIPPRRKR
jgi:hypothetical protein